MNTLREVEFEFDHTFYEEPGTSLCIGAYPPNLDISGFIIINGVEHILERADHFVL
jgi:hypothetical protein